MVSYGRELHDPVRPVLGIQPEDHRNKRYPGTHSEPYTYPVANASHIKNYEYDEYGQQAPGKNKEVLRTEPLELYGLADPSVDPKLRHNYDTPKKDLRIVALTIRKIQAPNQLAAVFEVSGSPELNLL